MKTFYVWCEGDGLKMNINSVTIGGFRNIDKTTVEIDDIISLLSINSYGKSNFLNAIVFGIDFIHQMPVVKSNMMNYTAYKPYNSKILFKNFAFELNFSCVIDSKLLNVIYGYSFAWQKNENMKPKILEEYLKIKDDNSQKYTSYISRNIKSALYKSSLTGSCSKKINIESNELIVNKIMAFDNLFYLDLIKQINNIFTYVDRHFNTNSAYGIQPIISKNMSDYNLDNNTNVPRLLFRIKNDYPDKFKLIVNTLKDIFPFILDIETVEYNIENNLDGLDKNIPNQYIAANKLYFLMVSDSTLASKVDFADMSDGVRRVLLILTTLTLADINHYSLVGIEEPENSLNPKILQSYLRALKNFTHNTKIIITSHSPYLINYFNPKDIYLGLPNNNGIANFSRIKEKSTDKLLKDADNMDMLVGDYLFDLMSGTEEDLKTMLKYVE